MDKRKYHLYVKGIAVPVSEEVYKAYWKITEHEKYTDMIAKEIWIFFCWLYHKNRYNLQRDDF